MDEIRNKVVLVGLNSPVLKKEENADEESMAELAALVETAGGQVVGSILQSRDKPDPHSCIGEGKVEEVKTMVALESATLVIFDNDLSPSQIRVLTELLGVQVIDRSGLILDIFAQRAKTREGCLQVELAQYQYLLPRLLGMWTHLERQEGAIGTRGPGETQLETDRRHIRRKIQRLQEDIRDLQRVRATQRSKREKNEIPLICIVGYTNAGKSTLLNALTGAEVHAADRLFDTLDPTTRLLHTQQMGDLLFSDTVGFIRKLPHHLIDAFRSTLEELTYADVLLHVVDASDEQWRLQSQVVEELISQLGAEKTPRILIFNKADRLRENQLPRESGALFCSALKGLGLEQLVDRICQVLGENLHTVDFVLPYAQAQLLDYLYRAANVRRADYVETGIHVEAVVDEKVFGRLQEVLPPEQRRKHEEF